MQHLPHWSRSARNRGHAFVKQRSRFGEISGHDAAKYAAFRLKWERHTEFSTYTLIEDGGCDDPFSAPPIRHIPHDWLVNLADKLLVALQIAVEKGDPIEPGHELLTKSFRPSPLVGSRVLANGEVWTDFQVAPDGYSYILVRDTGLRETQTGRLVQRLCEIETYRMMAFLALPIVREQSLLLSEAEAEPEQVKMVVA